MPSPSITTNQTRVNIPRVKRDVFMVLFLYIVSMNMEAAIATSDRAPNNRPRADIGDVYMALRQVCRAQLEGKKNKQAKEQNVYQIHCRLL